MFRESVDYIKESMDISEGIERGVGLESLLQEFAYDMASLSEEDKTNRIKKITSYYMVLLDKTKNVPKAYRETRKWANQIYVQHHAKNIRKGYGLEEKTDKEIASEIQDLINIQVNDPSTKKEDYMKGLGNGLVVAKAVADGKEPNWVNDSEKERFFVDRTNNHIDLVKKAAKKIVDRYPEFKDLLANAEVHDDSKFHEPERTPYLDLTWNKFKGIKDTDARINKATLYHITTNTHHPEYWNKEKANLDPNNRDKSAECLDASKMTHLAIAEMIADWVAMGMEILINERNKHE